MFESVLHSHYSRFALGGKAGLGCPDPDMEQRLRPGVQVTDAPRHLLVHPQLGSVTLDDGL